MLSSLLHATSADIPMPLSTTSGLVSASIVTVLMPACAWRTVLLTASRRTAVGCLVRSSGTCVSTEPEMRAVAVAFESTVSFARCQASGGAGCQVRRRPSNTECRIWRTVSSSSTTARLTRRQT